MIDHVEMSDGISIAIEITMPQQTPTSWVLFVHGFAGNRSENGLFDELAKPLVKRNMVVFRYDWRGLGDSEGSFANTSITRHVEDLSTMYKWVKNSYPHLPSSAVGFSLGAALIGLFLSSCEQYRFDKVVYLSPAVRPNLCMWPRYEGLWKESANGTVKKEGSNVLLGRPILESLRDTDLGEQAFDIGVPLLVCHGSGDTRVSHEFSQQLYEKVKDKKNVTFKIFNGASHSFRPSEAYWEELFLSVVNWLDQSRTRKL